MALLRIFVLVAVIAGGGYFADQWRVANATAAPAPVGRVAVQVPTERFPAAALDVPQHGRGPLVPSGALTGFAIPVGYELPDDADLLPGSAREYRGGFHEGIDFPLAFAMPVAAAKGGTIVRIDSDYTEWSEDDQLAGEDQGYQLGFTPEAILDKLRGRQVWIDHGYGVVTRYAHLRGVELFSVGSIVEQGTVIGQVGNSGTKAGPHLHIEIRIGDAYLGDGLTGSPLLAALRRAFSG
ncbi:MAG: peptidoglycan DD-metalloendopeptidase family protein [Gemmatimonadota bacterium]